MLDTISFFDLYLLFVLVPWVDAMAKLCFILSGIASMFLLPIYIITRDSNRESEVKAGDYCLKIFKRITAPVLILSLLFSAAPNREEIYFLVGGFVAVNIANNEEVQKLPANILGAVNSYLESFPQNNENKETK